jgi:polygalacturonase
MSAFNWFETEKRAFDLRTKTVDDDYTVKIGSVSNNFVFDRVIVVSDPAANCTITVPDGIYVGQQLIITLESNDNSKTVTIDGNAAQDSTMATAGMYQISLWTGATTGWVVLKESVTS